MLESIVLDVFNGWSMASYNLSFLGTSSLRTVTTQHMGNSPQAPLPWGLLRRLYLDIGAELTSAEGLDMLRLCPNLEICALYFPPILRHPNFPQPPLMGCCMEHLQQLYMVDDRFHIPTDPHKVIHFFNDLDLPHLRTLEYVAKAVNEFPLASLLTSVVAHLRSLSLRAPQIPGRAIFDVLHRVPSLAELVICSKEPFDDQFWNHMIPDKDGSSEKPLSRGFWDIDL